MKKILILIFAVLTFNVFDSLANSSVSEELQQNQISGTVTTKDGTPLPGVNIVVTGTTQGTMTDAAGKYSIEVPQGSKSLTFTFIGMESQQITIGTQTQINVTMAESEAALDEVVVIGYGTQKKVNLTGSVASVNEKELLTLPPVASVTSSLAGRMPGLIVTQFSGKPGSDAASLEIRDFGNALFIVDGVESNSFNTLDQSEIENISILKDASAAIYGSRAGNGVILVTTKRGIMGKPVLTLNSSYTTQSNTTWLHPTSSGDLYTYKREGWINAGMIGNAPATEEEIAKMYDGTDPQYANTDWYDIIFKKQSPQQQHNLSVRGGTDKIKYFGFFGLLDQQSFYKSNLGSYKRYNLSTNIDAKITDNLSAQMDVSAILTNTVYGLRASGGNIWQDLWDCLDPRYAPVPDKTKIPLTNVDGGIGNPIALTSGIAGKQTDINRNFKGSIGLNYSMPFLKGLSAKAFGTYVQDFGSSSSRSKPYTYWEYIYASQTYIEHVGFTTNTLGETRATDQTLTGQFSLNFNREFASNHNVSALLLYEVIDYATDYISAAREKFISSDLEYLFGGSSDTQTNDGSATQMGRASIVSRVNYSYKNRYLLEATLRSDASAKFPEEGRWGIFPGISAGWRISEENFMKNNISLIDNLKLRGSYSEMGNDAIGNFLYLAGYQFGTNFVVGNNAEKSIITIGLPNPYLTWETMKVSNFGLDISLFKRKIFAEFDVFNRLRDGIAGYEMSSIPSTFGANPPLVNINSMRTKGFEALIGSSNTIGDLRFDISANLSYSRSKWEHYEEPEYTDPDQIIQEKQSGNYTDRIFGYRSAGLFTSQEEIDNLGYDQDGQGNSTLNPGDIKLLDMNKDLIINWRDQVELGHDSPHWFLGINTQLAFKGFDLALLFQGAFDYIRSMTLTPRNKPTTAGFKYRWTPANNDPNALIPRNASIAATNNYVSDFRMKTMNYFRLKSANIGYNLPDNWLKPIRLTSVRIYVAGTNLFTFCKNGKLYGVDPEAPSGLSGYYYPQQRTVSFGINLAF